MYDEGEALSQSLPHDPWKRVSCKEACRSKGKGEAGDDKQIKHLGSRGGMRSICLPWQDDVYEASAKREGRLNFPL